MSLIFNVQKFSINDGPGIRTTIFFKGCPLRCGWCANPESQSFAYEVLWDAELCENCLQCVAACPQQALYRAENRIMVKEKLCNGCGKCVEACLHHALKIAGEDRALEDLVKVCLQDRDFYEESGGGVTLSGGEVLAHPRMAKQLIEALKAEHIHVAIETSGFTKYETFDDVTAAVDLIIIDVKHWQTEAHLQGTGVSNELCLNNLRHALQAGRRLLVRIPVIPGYNDSPEDAEAFCKLFKELGVQKVQLLSFHQYGEKKYELLGRSYIYQGEKSLHSEDLTKFRNRFLQCGVEAFF